MNHEERKAIEKKFTSQTAYLVEELTNLMRNLDSKFDILIDEVKKINLPSHDSLDTSSLEQILSNIKNNAAENIKNKNIQDDEMFIPNLDSSDMKSNAEKVKKTSVKKVQSKKPQNFE